MPTPISRADVISARKMLLMSEGSPFDEPPSCIPGSAAGSFQFIFLCEDAMLENTHIYTLVW